MPGFEQNTFQYLSRAALFVLPSQYEGLCNALIEAIACGVPSVSTDCPGGPREVLVDGQGGRLTPVDDPTAMADAIHHMLSHPDDARRMLAVAQQHLHRFTPEAAMRAWRSLIQEGLQR
jgi:glycosyltransferase involved in cell wall biosynthesis